MYEILPQAININFICFSDIVFTMLYYDHIHDSIEYIAVPLNGGMAVEFER